MAERQPQPSVQERLLRAALRRFARQGYHGTSMRQIAADAGVSLSNIYNYFPNKESLFATVLETFHPYREVLPELERLIHQAPQAEVEGLVLALARRLDALLQARPELLRLLLIEVVEFQSRHVAPLYHREVLPRLTALLTRWRARFPSRYAPEVVLRAFIGMMFAHHLLQRAVYAEAVGRLEDFVHIFLYGVLDTSSPTAGEVQP